MVVSGDISALYVLALFLLLALVLADLVASDARHCQGLVPRAAPAQRYDVAHRLVQLIVGVDEEDGVDDAGDHHEQGVPGQFRSVLVVMVWRVHTLGSGGTGGGEDDVSEEGHH